MNFFLVIFEGFSLKVLEDFSYHGASRVLRGACSLSWGIWDWLRFLCGVVHCGGGLVSVFQGFFCWYWRSLHFGGGTGRWPIVLWGFGSILMFPNFLRISVLSCSATRRQLVYTMLISNNRTSFHLWRKENLVKHQRVLKYYENDCVCIFAVRVNALCTFFLYNPELC